jgi:hypothetical protein
MPENAPIAIFAYKRPEHLRHTLETLMRCEGYADSPVFVFCDGPRNADEVDEVAQTREVVKSMLGSKAEYHFRDHNMGLANSITAGVNHTIQTCGRVIVIEDDLELHPNYLNFMNDALHKYAHHDQVFQVSGYIFDLKPFYSGDRAFFSPFISSWGWGTWERAWNKFDADAEGWESLLHDKKLRHKMNLDGSYDYSTMLLRQQMGAIDSWAIRWYWSVFKEHGLVLYPPTSLLRNTGLDGSGTNGRGFLKNFASANFSADTPSITLPENIEVDPDSYDAVKKALRKHNGKCIGQSIDWLRWHVYTCRFKHSFKAKKAPARSALAVL